jgi:hypothetical protein
MTLTPTKRIFFIFLYMALVLVAGWLYIQQLEKAEVYVCIYDMPGRTEGITPAVIEADCQPKGDWNASIFCNYKGFKYGNFD